MHAGLQAMLVMTLNTRAYLCDILEGPGTAKKCRNAIAVCQVNPAM